MDLYTCATGKSACSSRDRSEIQRLNGQRSVPTLVLDDGAVIVGSAKIVGWASGHN